MGSASRLPPSVVFPNRRPTQPQARTFQRLACANISCCALCGLGNISVMSLISRPHGIMLYMERTCEYCKKQYQTPPSQRPRFCSSACAGMAKRKSVECACITCGKSITSPPSRPAMYCSKSCHRIHKNTIANPSWTRDISGQNNPMFGIRRTGENNPMFGKRKAASHRWKGGRKIRRDGYVLICVPDDYPNPATVSSSGTKYALEHRVVMESHIGRYLTKQEVVHHIDENPSNNDISNLRLYATQAEHIRSEH